MSDLLIRVPFVQYDNPGLICPEESLTKQCFADECDFNNVLAKWQQSGLITHLNSSSPVYADVSDLTDYSAALSLVNDAQRSFDSLPSSIRDRFNNDPAALLKFLSDPSNTDEAIRLGLAAAPVSSDPQRAPNAGGGAEDTTPAGGE